jgi:CelD/BcsL family acetyltransferase involved in cellulose biosynthesis
MTIEDYPLSAVEPSGWHDLLERSGSTSPFCRYFWLKSIQEAYPDWRVGLVLADKGGRLTAGMPYVSSRRLLFRQSHSLTWGTPCGVPVYPGEDPSVADRLVEFWVERNARRFTPYRLSMTFPEQGAAGEPRKVFRGFREQRQRSLAVPLAGRTFEQWEASLDASVRNQNRQAVRRGAAFEQLKSPKAASELVRLAQLTAYRHNRATSSITENFYRILLEPDGVSAAEPGLARVFMVRVNGIPAAFSVCLKHSGRLWLWDYGADSSLYEARPNNMMYEQVISLAFEEGLDTVDLGAVPEGGESLENFKIGFGGVPYERTSWVASSGLFRAGAAIYRHFAR